MTIDVDCHANAGVPELFLHICERLAILDQERCERMAQIMEPNAPQPCFLQAGKEMSVSNVLDIDRIACFIAKNPLSG